MRRKDKNIADRDIIISIINEAQICRIGLVDNNKPYVVPMNFGYYNNCIYLHSSKEGRKIELLNKNNNVCFEVEGKAELITGELACNFSMSYQSVIGFGEAHFVDNLQDKIIALNIIMSKYSDKTDFQYSEEAINRICIIRIDIKELTGKKS